MGDIMTAKGDFELARCRVENLRSSMKDLERMQLEAADEANKAFQAYLVESKLLSQQVWYLHIEDYGCYLECAARANEWVELSEFAETNYHCMFSLGDDDYISFDDRKITINIKDINHLKDFMSKYGMQIRLHHSTESSLKTMQNTIDKINQWKKVLEA